MPKIVYFSHSKSRLAIQLARLICRMSWRDFLAPIYVRVGVRHTKHVPEHYSQWWPRVCQTVVGSADRPQLSQQLIDAADKQVPRAVAEALRRVYSIPAGVFSDTPPNSEEADRSDLNPIEAAIATWSIPPRLDEASLLFQEWSDVVRYATHDNPYKGESIRQSQEWLEGTRRPLYDQNRHLLEETLEKWWEHYLCSGVFDLGLYRPPPEGCPEDVIAHTGLQCWMPYQRREWGLHRHVSAHPRTATDAVLDRGMFTSKMRVDTVVERILDDLASTGSLGPDAEHYLAWAYEFDGRVVGPLAACERAFGRTLTRKALRRISAGTHNIRVRDGVVRTLKVPADIVERVRPWRHTLAGGPEDKVARWIAAHPTPLDTPLYVHFAARDIGQLRGVNRAQANDTLALWGAERLRRRIDDAITVIYRIPRQVALGCITAHQKSPLT